MMDVLYFHSVTFRNFYYYYYDVNGTNVAEPGEVDEVLQNASHFMVGDQTEA